MWGRVMQQNADHAARYQYIEARRREMDTESNWSTNAAVGGPGVNQGGVLPSRYVPRNWEYRNWEYVFNSPDETWDESRDRDRWAGLDYKAAHFTWTHKCYGRRNCTWSSVSQEEISNCGRCFSQWIKKYPTFNSSWRTVSQWYFTSPCDRWYFFSTRCKEFTTAQIHCGQECVDGQALKNDHSTRARL